MFISEADYDHAADIFRQIQNLKEELRTNMGQSPLAAKLAVKQRIDDLSAKRRRILGLTA